MAYNDDAATILLFLACGIKIRYYVRTPSPRDPQEKGALRYWTLTPRDATVIQEPAGREVCLVPRMSVKDSKPRICGRLSIV